MVGWICRRIPYTVALKRKHAACAALLNPSSAEPLVWPSSLKFISTLNPDAKTLLERALMRANIERERDILKGTSFSLPSPLHCEEDLSSEGEEKGELCGICFDQECTIEVRDCGHQMCAHCTLSLCCHNKPSPSNLFVAAPLCPFCRSCISKLVVAEERENNKERENTHLKLIRSWKSKNHSESGGSSSFKGLTFSLVGRGSSGRIADSSELADKPWVISLVSLSTRWVTTQEYE